MWFIVIFILFGFSSANSQTVTNHDFNDLGWGGMSHGSYWSIMSSGGVNNSPYARLTYSVAGNPGKALGTSLLALNTNIVWVEADVRMVGNVSGGSKFIKAFGVDPTGESWDNYNNLTLFMDHNQNVNRWVNYFIDTNCNSFWNGTTTASADCGTPNHLVTGGNIDLRGTTWHRYKAMIKRADSGVRNGEVKIWLNGNLHAHITGMNSNPNYSKTSTKLSVLEFGGYNYATTFSGTPWYFDVDNVYVGTTEKDTSAPELLTCYPDSDNDLYPGSGSQSAETCPTNYYTYSHFTAMTLDCNDTNAAINPGATEDCDNGIDEDCSGSDAVCGAAAEVGSFWLYKNSEGKAYVPAAN
jgi:hypothetical protein